MVEPGAGARLLTIGSRRVAGGGRGAGGGVRLHDERGEQREHPCDPVHADDRRETRERAVDLRIAAREPRETREHGAAQPFAEGPRARERERAVPGRRERPRVGRAAVPRMACAERPQPGRERRVQRQVQREQHERAARERRGHLAVHVHADVEPPDAADEVAEAERAARECGAAPARRARQLREKPDEYDELQPAAVRRRCEAERIGCAGEQRGRVVPARQRAAGCRREKAASRAGQDRIVHVKRKWASGCRRRGWRATVNPRARFRRDGSRAGCGARAARGPGAHRRAGSRTRGCRAAASRRGAARVRNDG